MLHNQRVIIELITNLTFCGLYKGEQSFKGKDGIFLETDSATGLRVWCPKDVIKDEIVIPTGEEVENETIHET